MFVKNRLHFIYYFNLVFYYFLVKLDSSKEFFKANVRKDPGDGL